MKNTGNKTFFSNLKKYGSKAMMFLICTCILMSVMSGFTITAGNGAVNYSAPNLNIDDSAKRQLEAELDKLEKEMDSLGDSMDALEAKKRQLAAEMGENAANIATLEEEKTTLDKEMNTLKKSITAAEELLKAYETEISNIEAEIIKREKAYEEKYRQFGERLRITHEAGRASDLELLFGAKSLSEFLSCVNRIGEMLKHDENMMKELEQERLALEALRALNEENRSKQIATIVDLGTAENELNTKIAKSENLISNAYDKQESIEAQQQMTESEQAKKEKQS